jgi:hypothetical protein
MTALKSVFVRKGTFFPAAWGADEIPLFEGGLGGDWSRATDTPFALAFARRGLFFPSAWCTDEIPLLDGMFWGGIVGRLRAIDTPFALAFAEKTPIVWKPPSLMIQWE